MSQISNGTFLRELTIPGTHDSSAFDTGYIGQANHVRAQVLNFEQQLNMGVRYFDIRIKQINSNTFALHHGPFYLGFEFDRVLEDCVKFLEKFQTETILLKIKVEQGSSKKVPNTIENVYMKNPKFMNYFWAYTTENPRLGDVRGKIVIVQNFKVNFNVFAFWFLSYIF
jgi:1-phosphatidylinositol phosphodiesterase